MQSVRYAPDGTISMKRYLDSFPSDYYVVVRDLSSLPTVLAEALKGWLDFVVRTGR
jgi:midasin